MKLSELCRMHKIEVPERSLITGFIEFVNPDANTARALANVADYKIVADFIIPEQHIERKHIVRLLPAYPVNDPGDNDTFTAE